MIVPTLALIGFFHGATPLFFNPSNFQIKTLAFNINNNFSGSANRFDSQGQVDYGPVIELYVSGRTLFTKKNSWTNIHIRSRNLSGTGCQSRINFNLGSEYKTKFSYAPPGTNWGSWNSVAQGLNGQAFSMSITELCDTGPIQYQVKYWPQRHR